MKKPLIFVDDNLSSLSRQDRLIGSYLYDRYNQLVGRVQGMLIEPDTEPLVPRYMVLSLGGLMSIEGKKILIPYCLCEGLDLGKVKMFSWSQESVFDAPGVQDFSQVSIEEEQQILSYFDQDSYWSDDSSDEFSGGRN